MDQLSSQLLGFPPDERLLIVNCNDFGMHDAVNAAVLESIEKGIASSCSLIVPCPAAADAMRLLHARPHIPFGIHLALIRDTPEYHWGPCADNSDVASLVEPDTAEFYVDSPALPNPFRQLPQLMVGVSRATSLRRSFSRSSEQQWAIASGKDWPAGRNWSQGWCWPVWLWSWAQRRWSEK